MENKNYELIKFEDGDFSLDVNVSPNEDTVWLTLDQISILFDRDKSVISRHIQNTIKEQELEANSVIAKIATTANDGKTYMVEYYNLDMILAVGYRVKWLNYMNEVVLLLTNIYQIYFQKTNYAKMKCVGNSDILQTTKNIWFIEN